MSTKTYLQLVNRTTQKITVEISEVDNSDWDGNSRPDRNFNGIYVEAGDSSPLHRQEIKNPNSPYRMKLEFANGDVVSFRNDQHDARKGINPAIRGHGLDGKHASKYHLEQHVCDSPEEKSNIFTIFERDSLPPDNSSRYLNPRDWMSKLNSQLSVSKITIPGTHETGATSLGLLGAKCQTLSITAQLNAGIRFLDIRGREELNVLFLWHGWTKQPGFVVGAIEECKNFLHEHCNETILMSVKVETDLGPNLKFPKLFKETCMDKLKSRDGSDLFYIGENIPKLGDVRGKIVLLRRFDFKEDSKINLVHPWGIDLVDWDDNKTEAGVGTKDSSGKRRCIVQDYYDLRTENESDFINKKFDAIKALLDKAGNAHKSDETMFINFCSASRVPKISPIPEPEKFAEHVNPKLSEYLTRSPRGMYGCVLMDFPENTPQLIHQLIASNF